MTEFLALTSRKLYLLGLLLPETENQAGAAQKELEKSPEIASFMKGVLEKHGERSLVYVRTHLFPFAPTSL